MNAGTNQHRIYRPFPDFAQSTFHSFSLRVVLTNTDLVAIQLVSNNTTHNHADMINVFRRRITLPKINTNDELRSKCRSSESHASRHRSWASCMNLDLHFGPSFPPYG